MAQSVSHQPQLGGHSVALTVQALRPLASCATGHHGFGCLRPSVGPAQPSFSPNSSPEGLTRSQLTSYSRLRLPGVCCADRQPLGLRSDSCFIFPLSHSSLQGWRFCQAPFLEAASSLRCPLHALARSRLPPPRSCSRGCCAQYPVTLKC